MEIEKVTWVPGMRMKDTEEEIIKTALKYFKGNKTKTAKSLGIAIRTIGNKLAKYKARDNVFNKSEGR